MKCCNRLLLRFILSAAVFIVLIAVAADLPIASLGHAHMTPDYSNWMAQTIPLNKPVIDIAMLGAHDAFTSDMTPLSRVDAASASSVQQGLPGVLIKGLSFRQSKTQTADAATLLRGGVRYFDIRLSYNARKEGWFTVHNYFSTPFIHVLEQIDAFLARHPGELLILDLQHVNGVSYDDTGAFEAIRRLFAESGVLAYAYPHRGRPLADITYGEVTDGGKRAGVIVLSKFSISDPRFFPYGASIRSAWANTDRLATLNSFLTAEAARIESHAALTGNQMPRNPLAQDSLKGFRVLQAVLTMQLSADGVVRSLQSWSLIQRARAANPRIIADPHFAEWLRAMPILMVDAAVSNSGGFLDRAMAIIIEADRRPS